MKPVLLIVDVQERLFVAMEAERREAVLRNIKILGAAAERLRLPVLHTEQYPKGLGPTVPELRDVMPGAPIEKTAFSCCAAGGFTDRLRATGADHVIVAGLETHVCVLLTALDLLTSGFGVSVVADAACSRRRDSHDIGLAQARQAGAVVTSTETVVFQLLKTADTDAFRDLSKLLR
jgi:nicotinamidase-related amidase